MAELGVTSMGTKELPYTTEEWKIPGYSSCLYLDLQADWQAGGPCSARLLRAMCTLKGQAHDQAHVCSGQACAIQICRLGCFCQVAGLGATNQ